MGLELLFATENSDEVEAIKKSSLVASQLRPHPPIALGVSASTTGATAAMDVSDGLVLDASRMAKASGVSMVFEGEKLTLAAADGLPFGRARELSAFVQRVREAWPDVAVTDVDSTGLPETPELGSALTLTAAVALV